MGSSEGTETQVKSDARIADPASSVAEASPPPLAQQSSTATQVLIVDDNPLNRNVCLAWQQYETVCLYSLAPCSIHEATPLLLPGGRKWV
jgi:hypothetical protein